MSKEHTNSEEMRMEDFESMLEESLKQPTRGSTVTGVIAQIQGNEVIVNISAKTEGIVDKGELGDDVSVGDSVELVVVDFNVGGYMKLSRKMIDERSEWEFLKDSGDKNVKVKIESKVEKGYRGKIGDINAFIPASHIDLKSQMEDPDAYVGRVLDAKVLKVSGNGRNRSALVSPKEFILAKINSEREEFLSKLNEGDIVEGVVKTIKEYGAFISFGTLDGFLHKSNIVWGRPRNPAKYVEEGQKLDVKILEINRETGKVEVGLKQLSDDPWSSVESKYPVEAVVKASVIGRRRNGYIAEIEPGIDAFIPLEELSWLKNVHSVLKPKDIIEGIVLDYDSDHKRVVISVRLLETNPWDAMKDETPEGTVVEGTIKNITDFGIFVDFGQAIDGLIRKGDISWGDEPENLEELYKAGDKVTVKVLRIDEERERISLGIKQLTANPWRDMPRQGSKVVDVTISGISRDSLDVTLPNGLKGIILSTELDPTNASLENYNVGDTISALIMRANPKDRVVHLSVRKHITDSERKEAKEYMRKLEKSEESQGFGAIFRDKLK